MDRRRAVRVALLLAALLAVLVPATTARSAPYTGGAALTVTASDPCIGGRDTYSGAGFVAGETVVLSVDGREVGSAVAGKDGSFTVALSLPTSLRGTIVVTATGAKASASTTVTVVRSCSSSGAGAGNQGAGDGSSGGSPAVTGVAVVGLLVLALALLVGGGFLVITGRRRSR